MAKLWLGGELDLRDLTVSGEVDASGAAYGVTVLRGPRPGWPDSMLDVAELAGRHGGSQGPALYEPLRLDLLLSVRGGSHADAQEKLDAVRQLLARDRAGARTLRVGLLADRFWVAQHETIEPPREIGVTRRFRATFVAADPRAWGVDRVVQEETIAADPQSVDVPAEGVVAGTADTEPVWIVEIGAGGAGNVGLSNETTGESVTYAPESSLSEGDRVRFDAGLRQIVELSTDGGSSWTPVMSDVTVSRAIPVLRAGVQNSVEVTGVGAGGLDVIYRPRWW